MTAEAASQIHVATEDRQLALPGTLWPAGCDRGQGDPLFMAPITRRQANDLIDVWGHPLGPFNRPFGLQAWGLAIDGEAVAVAISGSTVSATVAGYKRTEVTELARIVRNPNHPGIMRVMLRVWRDYCAPRWDYSDGPIKAVVSYALPGKHGNLYRFDGWDDKGKVRPWQGGATWSNPSRANTMGDGMKKLFCYTYRTPLPPPPPRETRKRTRR